MKTIVNNLAVEYTDEGRGPILLLLHGWKQDLHTFDALAGAFLPVHRVIRVDFPGFGGTEPPKEPWGVNEYGRFVQALCQKLGLAPDVLIGHSFGGRIALKSVAKRYLAPKKLILIGSAGFSNYKSLRNRLFQLAAKAGKAALLVFPASFREKSRRRLYRSAGSTDYLDAGVLKETFVKVTREDLGPHAANVEVPTLLIWGGADAETPLSYGIRLRDLIRSSRLEVIEGAGHFVYIEKPKEVAALIKAFLS